MKPLTPDQARLLRYWQGLRPTTPAQARKRAQVLAKLQGQGQALADAFKVS